MSPFLELDHFRERLPAAPKMGSNFRRISSRLWHSSVPHFYLVWIVQSVCRVPLQWTRLPFPGLSLNFIDHPCPGSGLGQRLCVDRGQTDSSWPPDLVSGEADGPSDGCSVCVLVYFVSPDWGWGAKRITAPFRNSEMTYRRRFAPAGC